MNPSTEDLLNACNQVDAQTVIILPNNSNIIMAAQQVVELCGKKVVVVPTRSVMQAITALIAYDAEGDIEAVAEEMTSHIDNVIYGEVTYAVRDSAVNGLTIKEGDTIGLIQDKVVLTSPNAEEAVVGLLKEMLNEDSELITLLYGEGITEDDAQALLERLQKEYPDKEIEVHYGGQPHYSYWISAE
jgi:dihydroxyacetone kinase-like predicted kinase